MILPRQEPIPPPPPSPPNEPLNPTVRVPSNPPRTALPGWQIALIVIGALAFLGLLGTLFILVRTRLSLRRAASTSRFERDLSASSHGFGTGTGEGEYAIDGLETRRGSNARSADESGMKRERRGSVVDDAKLQIRRLMKKTRPHPQSASYPSPSSPASPYKGGLDFGLASLRFGGSGAEKGANERTGGNGGKKKKEGRRKSQNGIDVQIRSADGHADDACSYGRRPFMKNDNAAASGSGFRIGSAGSGSNLMSAATPLSSRRDDDAFLTGYGRPGPGRGRDWNSEEQQWGYGDDSIAHTVRGSFEDAEEEEERQRDISLQHQQLSAAVERLAAERSWPGHDRGRLG